MASNHEFLYLWLQKIREKSQEALWIGYEKEREKQTFLPNLHGHFLGTSPPKEHLTKPLGFYSYKDEQCWNCSLEAEISFVFYTPYEGSLLGDILTTHLTNFLFSENFQRISLQMAPNPSEEGEVYQNFQLLKIYDEKNKLYGEKHCIFRSRGLLIFPQKKSIKTQNALGP